eukprot:1144176-Pelagomonas_calceolata.AAC.1
MERRLRVFTMYPQLHSMLSLFAGAEEEGASVAPAAPADERGWVVCTTHALLLLNANGAHPLPRQP